MLPTNTWFLTALIAVFIYNIFLFNYATKILHKARKNIFLYILLACVNTYIVFFAAKMPQYYFLTFFSIVCIFTLEFKLISKTTIRQSLFGAVTFGFHIASINLPVVMAFSYVLDIAPLSILEIPQYHYMILFISVMILTSALIFVSRVIPLKDIIRISSSSPYSETQTGTTAFILAYLTFDAYCFISYNLFPEQAYQIFAVTILSLSAFYYLLIYTINFIKLSAYKRQSDIAQSNYNELLLKKKEVSDKLITDHLTKLFNKKYVTEQLKKFISHPHVKFGLLFMDINALKYVNDTYGHEVGDEYIKSIAESLSASIRDIDIAARISGDEFLAILPYIDSEQSIKNIAQRISSHIKQQAKFESFTLSASIGYVFVDEKLKKLPFTEIIDLADQNMRENKAIFYAEMPIEQEVNNA